MFLSVLSVLVVNFFSLSFMIKDACLLECHLQQVEEDEFDKQFFYHFFVQVSQFCEMMEGMATTVLKLPDKKELLFGEVYLLVKWFVLLRPNL